MKINKCCICGREFIGHGNNPKPLKQKGICCDRCNQQVVLERIKLSLRRTE